MPTLWNKTDPKYFIKGEKKYPRNDDVILIFILEVFFAASRIGLHCLGSGFPASRAYWERGEREDI